MTILSRKRRSDRAYLIYKIVCTVNLECYVGLVVRTSRAVKWTLTKRLHQHVTRALGTAKGWEIPKKWALHIAIRKHGETAFTIELLETVRGRVAAGIREIELAHEHGATLNTKLRRK